MKEDSILAIPSRNKPGGSNGEDVLDAITDWDASQDVGVAGSYPLPVAALPLASRQEDAQVCELLDGVSHPLRLVPSPSRGTKRKAVVPGTVLPRDLDIGSQSVDGVLTDMGLEHLRANKRRLRGKQCVEADRTIASVLDGPLDTDQDVQDRSNVNGDLQCEG